MRGPRHAKAGEKEEKDVEEWKRSSEQERGEGMRQIHRVKVGGHQLPQALGPSLSHISVRICCLASASLT